MRDKQPLKLQFLFQTHNVILSSGSLLLLVLMLEEIIPIGFKLGPFGMICGEKAWTPVSKHSHSLFPILWY
jgi:fatty acid elongase 3